MDVPTIESLSIEQKIGQLFFIGIPGPELDQAALTLLGDVSPGGVCLFTRNIKERRQTRDLVDSLFNALPITPFVSIDQEGGRVDRLRRIFTPMPAAAELRDTNDASRLGSIIGETLSLLGLNMNFAPVVDVIIGDRASLVNGLQSRGLGQDVDSAIEFASAFLDAMARFNILGCLKHFPGLGAATVDSHEELPVVSTSAQELESIDLKPYSELVPRHPEVSVMVAHAAFPFANLQEMDASGNLLPSSLSKNFVSTLLRERLNFNGVVITDDLEMGAIVKNYGIGEACKMALLGGSDMLAICADRTAIYEGFDSIRSAVGSGEVSVARVDESLRRIVRLKQGLASKAYNEDRLNVLAAEMLDLRHDLN